MDVRGGASAPEPCPASAGSRREGAVRAAARPPHRVGSVSTIACAAARGSGARRMGRPTTTWSAPAAMACAGVAVRRWSSAAEPSGPHARRDDQAALRLGQRADRGRLARRGDHPVGPGHERARGALDHEVGHGALAHQARVEVGALQRGQHGDGEEPHRGAAAPLGGGAHDVRIAVDRQQVEVEPREAAHRGLDRGADVEELEVEEHPMPVLALELDGERESAAGQHPEPDLVEGHGVAQPPGHLQSRHGIGQVERHDQPVVGRVGAMAPCRVGLNGSHDDSPLELRSV